jgi:tRNA threonylcarbamoyladenosine biosynthesis protein TsaB
MPLAFAEPPLPLLILAMDASSSRCSVALWREELGTATGHLLAAQEREGQTGDAARLPAMVAELLGAQGLAVADLSAIAVSVGPGSFTGLRASLALAEGLAAGTGAGTPVIAVTVAEALSVAAGPETPLPLWCALDGRNDRLFLHRGGAPEAWDVAKLSEPPCPDGPIAVTGDGAAALAGALAEEGCPAIVTSARSCHAREVAIAAARRARGLLPPLTVAPLYIDPPRALLPKGGLRPPPALRAARLP